jgi:hypothetical protein
LGSDQRYADFWKHHTVGICQRAEVYGLPAKSRALAMRRPERLFRDLMAVFVAPS